jgi:hypothetical protein
MYQNRARVLSREGSLLSDRSRCAMPKEIRTVQDVIDEMIAIGERLGGPESTDGVAYFNRLYLAVTQAVAVEIQAGRFADRDFIAELDVAFARLYFDAEAAAGNGVPAAWRPLFEKRKKRDIAPLQFALAGMNAHINHDLPQALLTTWKRRGKPDDGSPAHADYLSVNDVLEQVEEDVKKTLEGELLGRVDRLLGKADDAVAMWSVRHARDHAWATAEAMWELRDVRGADDAIESILGRLVNFSGHGLLR